MRIVVVAALIAWCAPPAHRCLANPVPDQIGYDFQALVHETAVTGKCPDAARLTRYFSRYGIALLRDSDLDDLDRAFEIFAPLLVDAQRPCERLHYNLQQFYRERANAEQRAAMTAALRDWLTARLDKAPSGVVAPASAVRTDIQRDRCTAAEMLVAWGDTEAAPLVASVAAPDTMEAEFQWHIERSLECLRNPAARSFVQIDSDGSVRLRQSVNGVKRASIRPWNHRDGREHALTPEEITFLFENLGASGYRAGRVSMSGFTELRIEFADGVVATVNTSEPECIVYKDNTSLDWSRALLLENPQLRSWLEQMYRREIEGRSE